MPRPPHDQPCALCSRHTWLTFHHLIPRKNHNKPWFRRHFDKADMRSRGIWVCKPCHRAIHRFHDEHRLGRELNTLESLQNDPQLRRFVAWAARQKVQIKSRT